MHAIHIALPGWTQDYTKTTARFASPEERMAFVIELSKQNIQHNTGGPFAAAVFDQQTQTLISLGVNTVIEQHAAIAHAEIMALTLANQKLKTHDLGTAALELVTSSQPCIMCYGAVIWNGIQQITIGARGSDVVEITGFDEGPLPLDWQAQLEARGITVLKDVLRTDACQILRTYKTTNGIIYNSLANRSSKKT